MLSLDSLLLVVLVARIVVLNEVMSSLWPLEVPCKRVYIETTKLDSSTGEKKDLFKLPKLSLGTEQTSKKQGKPCQF